MRWDRQKLEVREVFAIEHQEPGGSWHFSAYAESYPGALAIVQDLVGFRITQRFALFTKVGTTVFSLGFHDTQEEAHAALEVERDWPG